VVVAGLSYAVEQTVAVELTSERDAAVFRQQFPWMDTICARVAA
jgi:hypothetical protein